VFLIDALLELLQARWNTADLELALQLTEVVLERFADPAGGFYFTADDHEALIQRPKPLSDDSLPAGNAIAAKVLGRLGHLLGETRYLDAAEKTLKAAWHPLQQGPYGHTGLLLALEEYLYPPETLVIRAASGLKPWQDSLGRDYAPARLVFCIPDDVADLPGLLGERRPQEADVAYLCQGTSCLAPMGSVEQVREQLAAIR
jgi:hypothetical protein